MVFCIELTHTPDVLTGIWDKKGTSSQKLVRKTISCYDRSWRSHLTNLELQDGFTWRLIKNPAFQWNPSTTTILAYLQTVPSTITPSIHQLFHEKMRGYFDLQPFIALGKKTGMKRASDLGAAHIGIWGKPTVRPIGKKNIPYITSETLHQSTATMEFLLAIIGILTKFYHKFLMKMLSSQDPKAWYRLMMYVCLHCIEYFSNCR
jgi:hypothetical protein